MKLAEAKCEQFPARWYDDTAHAAADLAAAGIPGDAVLNLSGRLELVEEHRLFVLRGEVVAHSPYRTLDGDYEPEMMSFSGPVMGTIGQQIVDRIGRGMLPDGAVVDVGRTAKGDWVVIEANPAWSSAPYDADMRGVLECVLASQTLSAQGWPWRPDPWLVQEANRKRPLRVDQKGSPR